MNNETNSALLAVTQEDRDAANKALDIAFRGDTSSIDDDMAALFVAHRIASQQIAGDVEERARELLVDLDKIMGKPVNTGPIAEACFQRIVTALSALSAPQPQPAREVFANKDDAWLAAHKYAMDDHSLHRDELIGFLRDHGLIGAQNGEK